MAPTPTLSSFRSRPSGKCRASNPALHRQRVRDWAGACLLLLATASCSRATADRPPLVLVHAGYGTPTRFVLTGRVVEDKGVQPAVAGRGKLANAADTVRLLDSHELPDVQVEVTVGGRSFAARTDEDGVWRVETAGLSPPLAAGTRPVEARLAGAPAAAGRGRLFILEDAPGVAVISDFDDTVVDSGVTNKARLALNTLTRNAAQMRAVPDVARAFREAERRGARAFFYVSGSPQNLHERIEAFLRLQDLPAGPILLKNVGADALFDQAAYKRARIEAVLAGFSRLRFVLVGDTGEQDPEIYAGIAREHPGRVVAILIRRAPGGDDDPERLAGMTVIDDFQPADVVARHVTP